MTQGKDRDRINSKASGVVPAAGLIAKPPTPIPTIDSINLFWQPRSSFELARTVKKPRPKASDASAADNSAKKD